MMCIVEASGNLWRLHSHVHHNQHQKQDDQDEDDFYDDDSDIREDMEMIIIRIRGCRDCNIRIHEVG